MEQLKGIHESNATKMDLKSLLQHWGKIGSIGYDGNSWYRFGIIECKVVDTMGAGDSFDCRIFIWI